MWTSSYWTPTYWPATYWARSPVVFSQPLRENAYWSVAPTLSPAWGFALAATLGLEMYRGEDRLWTFVPVPGAANEDISGWSIAAHFYNQKTPPELVLVKTTGGAGIVITNAQPGFFTLSIASADTDGTTPLAPGQYPGDIWRTDFGSERVLAVGALTILPTPSH